MAGSPATTPRRGCRVAVRPGTDIYGRTGADSDTVYVWEAVFFFGLPNPFTLCTPCNHRWLGKRSYAVPRRLQSFAVTGGVVG